MRLKYTFDLVELEDFTIAVPVGDSANTFHSVVRLNETAASVFQLLSDEISEESITEALSKQYGVNPDQIASDVQRCINGFREEGLLA